MQKTQIALRDSGKIASTNITNELASAFNGMGGPPSGPIGGAPLLGALILRVDSNASHGGRYWGVAKIGPLRMSESGDYDLDDMPDGPKCLIVNQGELDKTTHRIPTDGDSPVFVLGWLVGYTTSDAQEPIVWTNYNYAVRNVRITASGVWQETFEDKEDPDTATYQTITDSTTCSTG